MMVSSPGAASFISGIKRAILASSSWWVELTSQTGREPMRRFNSASFSASTGIGRPAYLMLPKAMKIRLENFWQTVIMMKLKITLYLILINLKQVLSMMKTVI